MGEAYKGLTVRFGGDTTSLQQALKSVSTSIRMTQSQLNAVKRALKLDPSNIALASTKMLVMQERAAAINSKLVTMRQAIRSVDGREFSQIASALRNIDIELKSNLAAYNAATARVKAYKNEMQALSDKTAAMNGVKLFDSNNRDISENIAKFKSLNSETSAMVDKLAELRTAWSSVNNAYKGSLQKKELQSSVTEVQRLEAELKSLAGQMASLNAESALGNISPKFAKIEESVKQVSESASAARQNISAIDSALKMDPSSVELVKDRIALMRTELVETGTQASLLAEKLNEMRSHGINALESEFQSLPSELRQAQAAAASFASELAKAEGKLASLVAQQKLMDAKGQSGSEYTKLASEITKAEAALTKLKSEGEGIESALSTAKARSEFAATKQEMDQLTAKTRSLAESMEQLGSKSKMAASSMTSIGLSMSTTVTPAVYRFGNYAVQAADDIDSAYRNMVKTVEGTDEQFQALKQSAIEFSQTNVTSTEDILNVQALGGQLGIAAENLDVFAQTVANLDVATNLDTETAATQLGQLSNILKDLDSTTMPRYSDALVRLGNNNATMESNITNVTTRIGSMASIIGMSTPDILALSTAVASTGQQSEAAGTAISKTMSDIENAVSSGGSKLSAFASVSGMTAEKFAQEWATSPTEALVAFIGGLDKVEKSGGSMDATLKSLGITSVRQKQALEGLANETDVLNDALQMSNDAWDGVSDQWGQAGDAANEAAKKSQGFSGQLQELRNVAQTFASSAMDSMVPAIELAKTALSGMTNVLNSMPSSLKTVLVAATGIAGVMGPIITFAGALRASMASIKKSMFADRAAIKEATAAMGSFSAANRTAAAASSAASKSVSANATAFSAFASKIGAASTGLTAFASGSKEASGKVKVLSAAMTALPVVVATAGIDAAAIAVEGYSKYLEDAGDAHNMVLPSMEEAKAKVEAEGGAFDTASSSVGKLVEEIDSAVQAQQELSAKVSEANSSISDEQSKMETAAATASALATSNVGGATDTDTFKNAIKDLNSTLGTNITLNKKSANGLSVTSSELQNLIEQSARAKRSAEAIDSLADAQSNVIKLQTELGQATDELNEFVGEGSSQVTDYAAGWADTVMPLDDAATKMATLQGAQSNANQALEKARETFRELQSQVERNAYADAALSDAVGMVENQHVSMESAVEAVNEKYRELSGTTNDYVDVQTVQSQVSANAAAKKAEEASATEKLTTSLNSLKSENASFNVAMQETGTSTSELASKLNSAGISADSYKSKFQQMSQGVVNGFNALDTANDTSLAKIKSNLDKNTSTYKEWTAQTKQAYKNSNSATKDFVSNLNDQFGVKATSVLKEFNSMSKSQQKSYVDSWKKSQAAANEAALNSLSKGTKQLASNTTKAYQEAGKAASSAAKSSATKAGQSFVDAAAKSITSLSSKMKDAGKNVAESAKDGASTVKGDSLGNDFGQGYVNGISAKIQDAYNEAYEMGKQAARGLKAGQKSNSPSKVTRQLGHDFGSGYTLGMSDMSHDVTRAARDMAVTAASATSRYQAGKYSSISSTFSASNSGTTYNFGNISISAAGLGDMKTAEDFVDMLVREGRSL